jgi:hypothetical protein
VLQKNIENGNKKPVTLIKIGGNIIDNPTNYHIFYDFSKIEV